MKIETFELERIQSLWENRVRYNLTESGIHPFSLRDLLDDNQIEQLLTARIGYGHTNGSPELRQAVAGLYTGAGPDNVLATNGSAEANLIAVWSLLEPGDELVLMVPNYMQIWGLARSLGVVVKPFHLREELGWGPDLDDLQRQITPKTRMIAVCNPNNPTGAVLSVEEMEEIIRIAEAAGAWLYADEVYRGAELDGRETPSFYGLYDKALVCAGLSKAYALPGLRLGWLAGPAQVIERAWAHHDYTTIAPGLLSDRIATIALQPETRERILRRNRTILNDNLAAFSDWVAIHGSLFSFVHPRAGGMAFLRYALEINSTELTTRLRENRSVLVIAGDCFGLDRYLRFGIGCEKDYLLAGLDLVDEELSLIKKEISGNT